MPKEKEITPKCGSNKQVKLKLKPTSTTLAAKYKESMSQIVGSLR